MLGITQGADQFNWALGKKWFFGVLSGRLLQAAVDCTRGFLLFSSISRKLGAFINLIGIIIFNDVYHAACFRELSR
jgi:hypothetical protein